MKSNEQIRKLMNINESMNINGNQRTPIKDYENQWWSINITHNLWKSYKANECDILNTKLGVINALNADSIGLTETYLTRDEGVQVEGYQWFGQNREAINADARRGSGGVGFLVKNNHSKQDVSCFL